MNILSTCFLLIGSSNNQVRISGEELLMEIIENLDSLIIIQSVCNGVLYANKKARVFLIKNIIFGIFVFIHFFYLFVFIIN